MYTSDCTDLVLSFVYIMHKYIHNAAIKSVELMANKLDWCAGHMIGS
jgi:hypothetical protein